MLRQSVWMDDGGWWWQRVVLGVWMLMTMVLTRSYEGNLMSLLAVRHLPQPYQTLRDVVDDPSVVMVWHKQGAPIQSVMDATSGIFNEVKASEEQGRLLVLPLIEYPTILDKVVNQRIAIIDYVRITRATRSRHFSLTGRCDFYIGQENIMAHPVAMISQKDSPLIPSLNARITSMTEAGLYDYWNNEGIANYSACERVPTKITISSSLSLRQCWAMLVVLTGGLAVGLLTLSVEVVLAGILRH
ncbi:ionotropic receptor 93a-like [Scylla paramamosain]|uniref:ionotropic receptor 93a-like n=1 Tax=Scylla paramamosain TaxID=85552 RepID=UPI0030837993